MPPPYGLTPEGFNAPTFEELRDQVNQRIWNTISPTMDLSDRMYEGQIIAAFCEQVVLQWQMGQEATTTLLDPDAAVDAALDVVMSLTGSFRGGASASTVMLTLTGDDATLVPTGSIGRVPEGGPEFTTDADANLEALLAWAPLSNYALDFRVTNDGNAYICIQAGVSAGAGGPTTDGDDITDGTVHWRFMGEGVAADDVPATATATGPLVANSGTVNETGTPVGGWLGVINLLDATPGANQMTNEEARILRETELAKRGSGPVDAIEADFAPGRFPGVTAVTVFNNTSDVTDGDGLPPHSVEVLLMGGEDQAIWNQLHKTIGGGIATHGTEVGTALDRRGREHTYRFSRVDEVEIWLALTVERDPLTAPADLEELIKTAIVEWGDAQENGRDAVSRRIGSVGFVHKSVIDIEVELDTAPAPSSTATIPIGVRQRAAYDTSRIAIAFVDGEP